MKELPKQIQELIRLWLNDNYIPCINPEPFLIMLKHQNLSAILLEEYDEAVLTYIRNYSKECLEETTENKELLDEGINKNKKAIELDNDLVIGPNEFYGLADHYEDALKELITAYEDILNLRHVESCDDPMEYSVPHENAVKIANRLLELDPNNAQANDTLDMEEGLLLVEYESGKQVLIPQRPHKLESEWRWRSKVIPRRITTLDEALKFAKWKVK